MAGIAKLRGSVGQGSVEWLGIVVAVVVLGLVVIGGARVVGEDVGAGLCRAVAVVAGGSGCPVGKASAPVVAGPAVIARRDVAEPSRALKAPVAPVAGRVDGLAEKAQAGAGAPVGVRLFRFGPQPPPLRPLSAGPVVAGGDRGRCMEVGGGAGDVCLGDGSLVGFCPDGEDSACPAQVPFGALECGNDPQSADAATFICGFTSDDGKRPVLLRCVATAPGRTGACVNTNALPEPTAVKDPSTSSCYAGSTTTRKSSDGVISETLKLCEDDTGAFSACTDATLTGRDVGVGATGQLPRGCSGSFDTPTKERLELDCASTAGNTANCTFGSITLECVELKDDQGNSSYHHCQDTNQPPEAPTPVAPPVATPVVAPTPVPIAAIGQCENTTGDPECPNTPEPLPELCTQRIPGAPTALTNPGRRPLQPREKPVPSLTAITLALLLQQIFRNPEGQSALEQANDCATLPLPAYGPPLDPPEPLSEPTVGQVFSQANVAQLVGVNGAPVATFADGGTASGSTTSAADSALPEQAMNHLITALSPNHAGPIHLNITQSDPNALLTQAPMNGVFTIGANLANTAAAFTLPSPFSVSHQVFVAVGGGVEPTIIIDNDAVSGVVEPVDMTTLGRLLTAHGGASVSAALDAPIRVIVDRDHPSAPLTYDPLQRAYRVGSQTMRNVNAVTELTAASLRLPDPYTDGLVAEASSPQAPGLPPHENPSFTRAQIVLASRAMSLATTPEAHDAFLQATAVSSPAAHEIFDALQEIIADYGDDELGAILLGLDDAQDQLTSNLPVQQLLNEVIYPAILARGGPDMTDGSSDSDSDADMDPAL